MIMQELQRRNLATRAYDELRERLMVGAFQPGQKLTLKFLSERLGTSQTPIREALMQLATEGALIIEPGRSPVVPLLTKSRFLELRDIRVALETLAAMKATPNITPALIEEMRALNETMMTARATRDTETTLATNRSFHFTLYRQSHLSRLIALIETQWVQTGPFMNFLYAAEGPGLQPDPKHPHNQILEGLARKDADMVADGIRRDIVDAGAPILSSLKETQDNGRKKVVA